MNLVVDYGNSAAKVGIFNNESLEEKLTFTARAELEMFLKNSAAENFIISSVKENPSEIIEYSQSRNRFILSPQLPLPVTNKYATPQTLGMDRIASACGAFQLFPQQNVLAIDAGTCITYEFIDKDGAYHGGGISPGLTMRFKAVHTFTAKLPLIVPKVNPKLVGNTTETSIQSGVVNGLIAEIDGIITRYEEEFGSVRVILCGGDTHFFENQLKASIFASPELVLVGLNSILNYNVKR